MHTDYRTESAHTPPNYFSPLYNYGPRDDMEVFHTADEFTILRQPNKLESNLLGSALLRNHPSGITVGYTYYKVTKVTADEANFYKDSARDAQTTSK